MEEELPSTLISVLDSKRLKIKTMKTIKRFNIINGIVLILLFCACVKDGEFTVPDITISEPNIVTNSSLKAIKTALQQEYNSNNKTIYTFPIDKNNPTYIEAFVISSDATGNFYKKLIVQDAPENPTAGIEILINKSSLYHDYAIGQKIYIKIDGLSVSYDDGQSEINPMNAIMGTYTLGYLEGVKVDNIPFTIIKDYLFTSSEIKTIVPTSVNLSSITENHLNTYIHFENIQFEKSQLQKTFSGEPNDEFDGFRYFLDCETQNTIRLQTSTFASFKSTIIPSDKGTIDAILTKNFNSEFLVTIINTPSDISFTNADRCDPIFLDCETSTSTNSTILFNEDFEDIKSNAALIAAGWNNSNRNGKNTKFKTKLSNGNRFIELSAYDSRESPLEVWLVSPVINLDNTTNEELTFETNTGYDNGKVMTVYISSDYTGNINTANWIPLDAALSEGPSSGYGARFTSSGVISISCLSGNVHIAFRYVGDDGGVTTTFQIDNIKVTGTN